VARLTAGARLRQNRQNSRPAVEPLAAPLAAKARPRRKQKGPGWRLYAIPLLLALTALTVFKVVRQPGDTTLAAAGTSVVIAPAPPTGVSQISIGEAPPGARFDRKLPAAELPAGAPLPGPGTGDWHVVAGTSPQFGTGKLTTYTVEVENGFQPTGGDAAFGSMVQQTLSNPKSWIGGGQIAVRRIDSGKPDVHIRLASQQTARGKQICGFDIPYDTSCRVGDNVYINDARWELGAVSFQGNMLLYQQYAINHEVGHFFGGNHQPCTQNGGLAPVMMQQTLSTANNDLADLTTQIPQGIVIPRDGKVCQANPWPFPLANQGR
jgi:Protein of unknown function (DUF3152)